jgi:hypothetical protein
MHFQKSQVLHTSASSSDSEVNGAVRDFYDFKRPIAKIFALGLFNRNLQCLKEGKLHAIDARLLKGIYTSDPHYLERP